MITVPTWPLNAIIVCCSPLSKLDSLALVPPLSHAKKKKPKEKKKIQGFHIMTKVENYPTTWLTWSVYLWWLHKCTREDTPPIEGYSLLCVHTTNHLPFLKHPSVEVTDLTSIDCVSTQHYYGQLPQLCESFFPVVRMLNEQMTSSPIQVAHSKPPHLTLGPPTLYCIQFYNCAGYMYPNQTIKQSVNQSLFLM